MRWVLDSYQKSLGLLQAAFQIAPPKVNLYLLGKEMYADIFRGDHPEWTQGYYQHGSGMYLNRAPVRSWDEFATREDRIRWAGENVQEVTERTTAHQLTHAALSELQIKTAWIQEGVAEHFDALIAPSESAARQLLQRRYVVRDAIAREVLPTASQLEARGLVSEVDTKEEFSRLYAVSALIVRLLVDTSGDEGLRQLVEAKALPMPLDEFIDTELTSWLNTPLPAEVAGRVICGIDKVNKTRGQVTADWNANTSKTSSDYGGFKVRVQHLLDSTEALPADTIVEEVRQAYIKGYSKWTSAIGYYISGDIGLGNSDLMLSNNLRSQGFDGFSAAWDRYVVAPCALIEEQLQSMAGGTTAS